MTGPARMVVLLATLLALVVGAQLSGANLNFLTANPLASAATAPDFAAPTAARSVVVKAGGGRDGHVRQGGTYYVYAEADDSGNPASGVGAVTADVSALTTGAGAVAMTSGAFTAEGQSYNRSSALLTADAALSEGTKIYALTLADSSAPPNAQTQTGFDVQVDNSQPSASSAIARTDASTSSQIKQGGTYHVYGNATDAGSPASGVDSVTADVSNVTTGQTAVALESTNGPWTVDGTTYEYRSAQLTASNPLAQGSKTHTVSATDHAGNVRPPQAGTPVNVDNTAPVTSRARVQKGEGGKASFIRQGSSAGSSFRAYANVTDGGTPASGLSAVTANLNTIVTGQTAVALTATGGPFTVDGQTYTHRSASLTPNATLTEGAKAWTVTARDEAGNASAAYTATAATADNVGPTMRTNSATSGLLATNVGATTRLPEATDTLRFITVKNGSTTTSDPLEPDTVLPGWTGATTNDVTATYTPAEELSLRDDAAGGAALGKVTSQTYNLNQGTADTVFGATGGTRSRLAQATNTLTLTLGTRSGQALTTGAGNNTLRWTPGPGLTDYAGNPLVLPVATPTYFDEPGAADLDW